VIGILRCDRCRRGLATAIVVGPHRVARFCVDCVDVWHEFRELVYGGDHEPDREVIVFDSDQRS
jgi:hypothetical protein